MTYLVWREEKKTFVSSDMCYITISLRVFGKVSKIIESIEMAIILNVTNRRRIINALKHRHPI